ncbi:unnamed protein product [Adineta ricciae]|uniref:Uncharacterized protein n=2 Tax=Adineta ricciae TaxID=249248 RepID=A0A815PX71_ADIRI|nr:unnamed protein product [Adineta ricciae]
MLIDILNPHPSNLPFELVYRLLPFREHLSPNLYNLLDQCLLVCPLLLITDDQRPQYLLKCPLGHVIYSKISNFFLLVVTDDSRMFQFQNHFRTIYNQSEITYMKKDLKEKIISALYYSECLCCLTSSSEMIVKNVSTKQTTMQIPCHRLISFIKKDIILIISSSQHTLQIWNCAENNLISEYDCGDDIIEDYFLKKNDLKLTFKSSSKMSYFTINKNCQLEFIRTVHRDKNSYQHCILLDLHIEFFYSLDSSKILLTIHRETNPIEVHNDIDFHSLPDSVVHLPNSNSIGWLTPSSVMILNPLCKEKIFQPFCLTSSSEYDLIHDNYNSHAFSGGLGNLIACINRNKSIVDIYEWLYDKKQQKHVSYLLSHVQLDIYIDHCVFEAENPEGITLYCSDGKDLYKYSATMLSCLVGLKTLVSSEVIRQRPRIHLDRFLTYTDNDQDLKICTLNEMNKLDLHLSIPSVKQCYFTKSSSHALVIDRKNLLAIYSMETKKLTWTTNEFQHRNIQIHSLQSSFVLFCSQTKQVFQIDTKAFQIKILIQLAMDCSTSTLSESDDRLFILSKDQTHLFEYNLVNSTLKIRSSTIRLNSSKVLQMYSFQEHLVFHNTDNQIFIWHKENDKFTQLDDAYQLIIKDNLLVYDSIDRPVIIIYNLVTKSRKVVQLDDATGACETFCLSNANPSDSDEQYLFVICSDRLLRMYRVSNGEQMAKLFIEKELYPFVGILNDRLLLKIDERLCIVKIIDRNSLSEKSWDVKHSLFNSEYWLKCHDIHFA